jgi:hypothetical protein
VEEEGSDRTRCSQHVTADSFRLRMNFIGVSSLWLLLFVLVCLFCLCLVLLVCFVLCVCVRVCVRCAAKRCVLDVVHDATVQSAAVAFLKEVTGDRGLQQSTGDAMWQAVKFSIRPSWLAARQAASKQVAQEMEEAALRLSDMEAQAIAIRPDTFHPIAHAPPPPLSSSSPAPFVAVSPASAVLVDGVPVASISDSSDCALLGPGGAADILPIDDDMTAHQQQLGISAASKQPPQPPAAPATSGTQQTTTHAQPA